MSKLDYHSFGDKVRQHRQNEKDRIDGYNLPSITEKQYKYINVLLAKHDIQPLPWNVAMTQRAAHTVINGLLNDEIEVIKKYLEEEVFDGD